MGLRAKRLGVVILPGFPVDLLSSLGQDTNVLSVVLNRGRKPVGRNPQWGAPREEAVCDGSPCSLL